jgi:diketogulonate reductase-like aldo/keto reductase
MAMRSLSFPHGGAVPALGLGTWRLGETPARRAAEVAVLREAIDIGYRLFDTAEMYADGGAEEVVGAALNEALAAGLAREGITVVSKFYPHHADRRHLPAACDRSRRRLGLDCIDLYLLHWRGNTPLEETVDTLQELQQRGHIGRWGVSNLDLDDMQELVALPGGDACAANQVYLSLGARGVEFELLPWQQQRGMPLMAYSPIDQGDLCRGAELRRLADELAMPPATLALAWVLSRPGVMAIPKAARRAHLEQNWAAASATLDSATLAALDALFPPPRRRQPLAMR